MDLSFYTGAHSATFEDKNSWTDWHLIPISKAVIPPPSVKTRQVDLPGIHGALDLTTVMTGYPMYNTRTGSLSYILAPGFEHWETVKSDIMNYLQGRTVKLYLDDDPGFYYQGIVWVNELKSDARVNSLSISYNLYPFKKEIVMSDEDWLWDPFNFENGVIRSYNQVSVNGSLTIDINDCTEPVTPSITVSSAMTISHTYTFKGISRTDTYSVSSGTSVPGFTIRPGNNQFVISGNGTITFSYRGGRL